MLNKKYCPILISMPRNGSTWVQSYVRASYKNEDVMIPSKFSNEFFGSVEYDQLRLEEKIDLIEKLEKLDIVVSHKVFADMFMDSPDMFFKWFKSFYKDYNIILLRRRNIWKTYISLLFHYTIQKHLQTTISDVNERATLHTWTGKGIHEGNEDLIKSTIQTYKVPFIFNPKHFTSFANKVRFYQDEVIAAFPDKWQMWLEDLSDEKLAKIFKVEIQKEVAPLKHLNYTTYYKPKELKLIQDTFEERFENEFRFYGYEYK